MTDAEPAHPAAPLVPQRGAYWATTAKLWRAAFRPHPARFDRAIGWALMLAGAAVAYVAFDQPASVWLAALIAVVIVAATAALARRRLWPWQSVYIAESTRRRREIQGITGTVDWAAATRWLATADDAPPWDRYRVLGFVGHDDVAEALIPMLPTTTPGERFWRSWAEVRRDWRSSGTFDVGRPVALLPEIDGRDRPVAQLVIDWLRGLGAVATDEPLTGLRPPAPPRLGDSERFWVLWGRCWVGRWLVGAFLLMSLLFPLVKGFA